MNCPHCNVFNPDDARFCAACGKASSATEPVSHPHLKAIPDLIGKEIAGRYRVQSKIGEGGMGAVYKAEQISLKRQCAVKLLRPDVAGTAIMLARFNAEAQAVAKLSHPNTVGIYDFGQDTDGMFFIAMEFVEGKSLRETIHTEAPFPLRRALSIAAQVAASLADAHVHSIVHRDLKPDNVMLQTRGRQKDIARVLDFGIAKLRDEGRATQAAMTQAGDMLGTPQYMAPEQIRGEQIDGRTDVYALGCMLYEMTTARMPFEAPTVMALLSKHLMENPPAPSQRRPDLNLPPVIDQLIMTAISKDRNARAATMEIFGEQIAQLLAQLPPDAGQPSAPMSAMQPIAGVTGAPNYGTPQGAYGAYAPQPVPPTAALAQFQPPPPPPGPAPGYGTPPPPGPPPGPAPSYGTPPPPMSSPYGFQTPVAPMPMTAPAKSGNAKTWIAIGACVALLGGIAIAFANMRGHDGATTKEPDPIEVTDKPVVEKLEKPEKPDKPDKPVQPKKDPDKDPDTDDDPKAGSNDPMAGGDADVDKFLSIMETLKNQLCKCTTQACATAVSASMSKYAKDLATVAQSLAKANAAAVTKFTQIQTEMAACSTRLIAGGAAKPTKTTDNSMNAQFDRFADRSCECTNVACARGILAEITIFARASKNKQGDDKKTEQTAIRLGKCLVKAGMSEADVVAAFQALAEI